MIEAAVCFCLVGGVLAQQQPAPQPETTAPPTTLAPKPAPASSVPAIQAPVNPAKVNFDTSETLFSFLAALNACGYNNDLDNSDPLRSQIRSEVAKATEASADAREASTHLCDFYRDHQTGDGTRDLAQYVSLALMVEPPPKFAPRVKEAELPPDANYVLGFLAPLALFYEKADLHKIWLKHREQYNSRIELYHEPVAKMVFNTDLYLKLPFSGYLGRGFTVYLEPLGPPGQANARNYGNDYFVVLSASGNSLKIDQIRHTYLHYVLDPLAMKRVTTMKRLTPLLDAVKTAPMDESFKGDISLLLTESMIRAIEIRTAPAMKDPADQKNAVTASMEEGYILTQYFYDALAAFEKDPVGLRDAYPDMLFAIDLGRETKRASVIQFAAQASPEILAGGRPRRQNSPTLRLAEQKLSIGDIETAQKLAQQALDEKKEDAGYALFILARASSMSRNVEEARSYFERSIEASKEPKIIAWSHIYLGRILDLQDDRASALEQYRAALQAGNSIPEIKTAAERGLQRPYEPPAPAQSQPQQ